tara:strand:+ start:344 stop:721 length:378 start_codon:yes stop_codon:yes gene_type:complete
MKSNILGLILAIASFILSLWYAFIVEGAAGNYTMFLSVPSFVFVLGFGIGINQMRKHTIKKGKLGKALRKDFILAGWLGLLIGTILIGRTYSQDELNLGGGIAAASITVLYGYFMGIIAESFVKS